MPCLTTADDIQTPSFQSPRFQTFESFFTPDLKKDTLETDAPDDEADSTAQNKSTVGIL